MAVAGGGKRERFVVENVFFLSGWIMAEHNLKAEADVRFILLKRAGADFRGTAFTSGALGG